MKFLVFILASVFLLTGCGGGVEISDRDFVVMAGIDKTESGGYSTCVGSAVLSGDGDIGSVTVKSAEGESLPKALEMSELTDALSPYYGHTKTVLLGESLLKDEKLLKNTVEVLTKNNDINMKTIILGCKGDAADCIKAASEKENDYGLYIWDFYKNGGKNSGVTYKMTVNDIAMKKDSGYILPKAYGYGSNIDISGGIVMDGYEFKGILDSRLMRGCMLVNEKLKGTVLDSGCDSVKIKSNKSKFSFTEKDNSVLCGISIYIKVQPLTEDADLTAMADSLAKDIREAVKLIYNTYDTDALDIRKRLERFKPSLADRDIQFDVKVHIAVE